MKPYAVLASPWRATHRSLRWVTLVVFALCSLGAVGVGIFVHAPHWWLWSTIVYCVGAGYLWAFLMPVLLLVSIDARHLCLPGVSGAVVGSLFLYGVLSVTVPTALLAAAGAPAASVALLVALAVATGLAFMLLPRYLSMAIGFLPALAIGLKHLLAIPSVGDPRFIPWGMGALAVLLLLDGWCWRRLLLADWNGELGLSSAMVMQIRRQGAGVMGQWGHLRQPSSSQHVRQRPDWQQARADLRRVGPQTPVLALCTALGSWYMPQRWSSYLRQAAPVLLPLILFVPVMALMQAGEAHGDPWRRIWMSVGVGVVGWIGIFGAVGLAVVVPTRLRQRWTRVNAELPLLALLPGLGSASALRGYLLRAVLGKPLMAQALLLVVVLGAAITMHLSDEMLVCVAFAQLGCAGVVMALVLATLGGRDLPLWGTASLLIVAFLLISASTFLPLLTIGKNPWHFSSAEIPMLGAGWLALVVALCWLGRRGWQGLQQRPHPFLVS